MKKILLCLVFFHSISAMAINEGWFRGCLAFLAKNDATSAVVQVLVGDEQQGMYLMSSQEALNGPHRSYRPIQEYKTFYIGEKVWVKVGEEESKETIQDLTEDGLVKIFSSYLPFESLSLRKITQ